MSLIVLLATAAAVQSASATLSVGATVIRPEPARIAIADGRVAVRPVDNALVAVEGGSVRRTSAGTLLITPAGPGLVRIVFTY